MPPSIERHHQSFGLALGLLLGLGILAGPLAADTFIGVAFRDDDANRVRSEQELGVEGLRLVAHTEDGEILAQGTSGADGRFEMTVDAEAGTTVHLMATGLGGRWVARSTASGPMRLTGNLEAQSVDIALVNANRLVRDTYAQAMAPAVKPGADTKRSAESAAPNMAKIDFPSGLPYPNVGPLVTLRCAGSNNVFNLDPPMDDFVQTVSSDSPSAEPHHIVGSPYEFPIFPEVGERCRFLTSGDAGAVPPGE